MSESPRTLKEFIFRHINSVEQLEILLFLRNQRNKSWSAEEINARLQTSVHSIGRRMQDLISSSLVVTALQNGAATYRYEPKDPGNDRLVETLGQAYKERPIRIVELIFTRSAGRIQDFADAFRLKNDEEDRDG